MDKKQLIEWLQGLPDDFQALPIEISEVEVNASDWRPLSDFNRVTYTRGRHERKVETSLTLRLNFTAHEQVDYHRNLYTGEESFTNLRRVKK